LALALVLASQPLASALNFKPLNLLGTILDDPPHRSPLYFGVALALLGLGAIFFYFRRLNPYVLRRPAALVFLSALPPALFAALALVAYDFGESGGSTVASRGFGWPSRVGAPLVALLPPLLLLGAERLAGGFFRLLGDFAGNRGWRRLALRLLGWSLSLRPAAVATRRRLGLLHCDEDECEQSIALLSPLGPIAESEDEERIHALERCYRRLGRIREALECLLRTRRLKPDQPSLDRRILDDYVKLEMRQEALDLLESGRIKQSFDMLMLRQRLNVELDNVAQALSQIRRIADQEGAPYDQSIQLYTDLMERLPDHVEIRINLGELLLSDEVEDRRREGAALLEQVLEQYPQRLHLARRLVDYYTEAGAPAQARVFLDLLIRAGDSNVEYYLLYAQQLLDENRVAEAVQVLQAMVTIAPHDWRGHLRLARIYFRQEEMDRAEAQLAKINGNSSEEAEAAVSHLRRSIETRRREHRIATMQADLERDGANAQKRINLIDALLEMEWIDQAIEHCERLLEQRPSQLPLIEERIRQAIGRVERSFRLLDYLADLLFQQGRYEETLALYREMAGQSLHAEEVLIGGCHKILARAPEHLETRRELALILRAREDWAGVLGALGPLLNQPEERLESEDKALWVEAAFRERRFAEAALVGLSLADELAAETGYMLMLMDILREIGDEEAAYEVFCKAREADPTNERLRRMERPLLIRRMKSRLGRLQDKLDAHGELSPLEHFEKAELHRDLEQFEEAIVHYQRAAEQESLATMALTKMAASLCDRGMYDLAGETLEQIELTRELTETHPELKELVYTVARALEKIRRVDQAVTFYKRIFRVDAAYQDVVERIERLT